MTVTRTLEPRGKPAPRRRRTDLRTVLRAGAQWTGAQPRKPYGVCGGGSSRHRRREASKGAVTLPKLMLPCRPNAFVSLRRRVTEVNAGRKTAGVDGEVALTPEAKDDLAEWVQHRAEPWVARPVKRVYIAKRGSAGKRRPLGIPVIADRALQAVAANALEPE